MDSGGGAGPAGGGSTGRAAVEDLYTKITGETAPWLIVSDEPIDVTEGGDDGRRWQWLVERNEGERQFVTVFIFDGITEAHQDARFVEAARTQGRSEVEQLLDLDPLTVRLVRVTRNEIRVEG